MGAARPLTARSVLASTLLGTEPPWLPTRLLVRSAELFGIAEGTTRVAISRMQRAGELEAHDGGYRLVGRLLERQDRQAEGRHSPQRDWDGTWVHAVVIDEARPAAERTALRSAMATLRMAEERPGVWTRPDNLDPARHPRATEVADGQCRWWRGSVPGGDVAGQLWDLAARTERAESLLDAMSPLEADLREGDVTALAPGFVVSAAVLRHLLDDPLLPVELQPEDWRADELRERYDRFDAAFRECLRGWFHDQALEDQSGIA